MTVVPDENGQFEIGLPDLDKQTNLGDGEFQFILQAPITSNIIAFLKPTVVGENSDGIEVSPSYPSVVLFTAERR